MKVEDYVKKGVFERVAKKRGWYVNTDKDLIKSFAEGLVKNKERYGMAICPCRFATGKKEVDRKIICPCVYAEEDIKEYGKCYCGLYVSREFLEKRIEDKVIPDRHFKCYLED